VKKIAVGAKAAEIAQWVERIAISLVATHVIMVLAQDAVEQEK